MKCPKCDTSDFREDNGYYVCQICGHKIPKETTATPSETTATPSNGSKTNSSKTLILGILGIVFAWLFAIVGHALSIIGIVVGLKEKRETGKSTGLTICIIGEVCAVISSLIGIILSL